jgi:hypothetical protein
LRRLAAASSAVRAELLPAALPTAAPSAAVAPISAPPLARGTIVALRRAACAVPCAAAATLVVREAAVLVAVAFLAASASAWERSNGRSNVRDDVKRSDGLDERATPLGAVPLGPAALAWEGWWHDGCSALWRAGGGGAAARDAQATV